MINIKAKKISLIFIFIMSIISLSSCKPFWVKESSNLESSIVESSITQSSNCESSIIESSQHQHSEAYEDDGIKENIIYDNFQIHFLELGNEYAGDSVYIKANDYDILIDAGSRKSSAQTIEAYIDKYCTDGKLEYVIATHSHQDHISGFVGNKNKGVYNGILYKYQIDTIIDFSLTNSKTSIYEEYITAVEYAVSQGATHHFANWYFDDDRNPKSDANISLGDNISFDIIYNKYYFEESKDENDYSVCTMFNYNGKHFLLTGDMEEKGEEALAEYYDNSTDAKTLPKVELFKAGHHGSKTSSNECLLEKIEPKICVVCCCAGTAEYTNNTEHQFPTQAFINRIAKYTSRVYVTSVLVLIEDEWKFASLNGNIIMSSDGNEIGLSGSSNLIRLKDTEWFNEEIYVIETTTKYAWNKAGDYFMVTQNCLKTGSHDFYNINTENAVLKSRRIWP